MNFDRMLAPWQPAILSLFRFVTGLLLLQFGVAKWLKFPAVPAFANPAPLSLTAGALELIGGTLLVVGLFTRPVAFILSGLMACAYFIGHVFKAAPVWLPLLNGGTPAIAFCFMCLLLAATGGGPISLDAIVRRKA